MEEQEGARGDACQRGSEPLPSCLFDLDDGVLLAVFRHLDPLPDLFSIARSCWRFRRLVDDRRMWLVVAPSNTGPAEHRGGSTFRDLQTAVKASRPGDTIWLSPHVEHAVSDVVVPWPLHLLGGGLSHEDTVLAAPRGADAALDFRATCKVANLSIRSVVSPCVVHCRGLLTLERCALVCNADGLDHLCAPLVTVAAAGAAGPAGMTAAVRHAVPAGAMAVPRQHLTVAHTAVADATEPVAGPAPSVAPLAFSGSSWAAPHSTRSRSRSPSPCPQFLSAAAAAPLGSGPACLRVTPCPRMVAVKPPRPRWQVQGAAGPGRLCVVETSLQGGSRAVHCRGTGDLRSVRVIYGPRARTLFWFEVDSSSPGPVGAAPGLGRVKAPVAEPWHVPVAAAAAAGRDAVDVKVKVEVEEPGGHWGAAEGGPTQVVVPGHVGGQVGHVGANQGADRAAAVVVGVLPRLPATAAQKLLQHQQSLLAQPALGGAMALGLANASGGEQTVHEAPGAAAAGSGSWAGLTQPVSCSDMCLTGAQGPCSGIAAGAAGGLLQRDRPVHAMEPAGCDEGGDGGAGATTGGTADEPLTKVRRLW